MQYEIDYRGKTLINFRFSFPHEIWHATSIKTKKTTDGIGKRQQIDQFLHVIINTRILRRTRAAHMIRVAAARNAIFFCSLVFGRFVLFLVWPAKQMRFVKNDEQIN